MRRASDGHAVIKAITGICIFLEQRVFKRLGECTILDAKSRMAQMSDEGKSWLSMPVYTIFFEPSHCFETWTVRLSCPL
jgi:hypothetical protein